MHLPAATQKARRLFAVCRTNKDFDPLGVNCLDLPTFSSKQQVVAELRQKNCWQSSNEPSVVADREFKATCKCTIEVEVVHNPFAVRRKD